MSIPESQLQTWSNQGAIVTAQTTHNSIRTALEAYDKWSEGVRCDPYLQGSYKNSTNIYGNSDVDLVVELTSVNWSNLTDEEKSQMGLTRADYDWSQFRKDVISALVNYYGSQLVDTSGKKSIKVLPDSGRLKADVVVCGKYRHYENKKIRAEGIIFWTQPGWQEIINYPKVHFNNGADKNSDQRTKGWYRQSTRMFKNARDKIVGEKPELKDKFPSYFVECLLYNVPDSCYGKTFQDTYAKTVNWLNDRFNQNEVDDFICQNGMYYLFGGTSVQWNNTDAQELVSLLIALWNNW
jgi:hypothetical protein